MAAEAQLQELLTRLQPQLQAGRFVFVRMRRIPDGIDPLALVHEDEGLTLVIDQADADRLGVQYDYVAAMITLRVHSALNAVGLTAAVAIELANADMSCNVIAGYHHDHLFVPVDRGAEAVALLDGLSRRNRPSE